MSNVSVIILTFNDEIHIERTIKGVLPFAREVIVVDSFSTDRTREISEELGARFYQHAWENSAGKQLNWAFRNIAIDGEWTMFVASDEYPVPELIEEIESRLDSLPPEVTGVFVNRRIHFLGRWIRHGDVHGRWVLRILRTNLVASGKAYLEERMDEHVVIEEGRQIEFKHEMVDDNLRSLAWFVEKHNGYATREVNDRLAARYLPEFAPEEMVLTGFRVKMVRWLKNNLYYVMPPLYRSAFYFAYRYFLRLGFLDGREGLIYHFLQGFWYRFLVDAKLFEVEVSARLQGRPVDEIVRELVCKTR